MEPEDEQKKAYESALKNKWEEMVKFCQSGLNVMAPVTIARDCPLHVALQSKKAYPLDELLKIIEEKFPDDPEIGTQNPVFVENAYGNTVLHQAAIFGNYEAVKLIAEKFPELAKKTNKLGETPLFRAASFGNTEIVDYLVNKVADHIDANGKVSSVHRKRATGTSLLHVAVQGEHFETALFLLNKDESLGKLKDKDGMTALHLLAQMPSAFPSGYQMGVLTRLLYLWLPVEEYIPLSSLETRRDTRRCEGWPIMKKIWDDKKKHMFARELACKLIKKDFSWKRFVKGNYSDLSGFEITFHDSREEEEETQSKQTNSGDVKSIDHESDDHNDDKYTPTPLFIATENGIIEIVRKTLNEYPQAVEHIDGKGRNILHLAISHRRNEIFQYLLKKMRKPIARLKLGIDNCGYTLLHHAADTEHYIGGSKLGPALQLQEELQWFEVVEELVPSHYALHRAKSLERNKKVPKKYTALELFRETHNNQLENAQKWVKDTSQSCSTVAVLVATVVFAAAYTIPGGNNEKGVPILSNSPYFLFFTIMDVISLACSLTSVVMFLSILTSPFELQEFRHSLPRKLTFGFTLLFFSVVTTMLTFGATILLTMHLEQKMTSLLSAAAFFPVLVFAIMQFQLYVAFMGTIKELFNDISNTLPSCFLPSKDKLD